MEPKIIAALMGGILFLLFITFKFFRNKEIQMARHEAYYVEALQEYKKNKSKSAQEKVFEAAQSYGKALGKSDTFIEKMVQRDLSFI